MKVCLSKFFRLTILSCRLRHVYREGAGATVPGTNVPRLRPVPLGPRAVGFFNDELQSLIEALRRFRDGAAS